MTSKSVDRHVSGSQWLDAAATGLRAVFLLAVTASVGYTLTQQVAQSDGGWIWSLSIKTLAAIALYGQADYYRRRVLGQIPDTIIGRLSTLILGGVLAILAVLVTLEKNNWIILFGYMMFILFLRNVISYITLILLDSSNSWRNIFGGWSLASLGYTIILFAIAPIISSLKLCNPTSLTFPVFGWELSSSYLDIAPAIGILIGMSFSIQRLDRYLKQQSCDVG